MTRLGIGSVALVLVVASCGGSSAAPASSAASSSPGVTPAPSISPTVTATVATTTTAPPTTTFPIGDGVLLVGEGHYAEGTALFLTDYWIDVPPDEDHLAGVGFTLPVGAEIRAPFDGLVFGGLFTPENRVTRGALREGERARAERFVLAFYTRLTDLTEDDLRFQMDVLEANIELAVDVRLGDDPVPVSRGDLLATIVGQQELPGNVEGNSVVFEFDGFDAEGRMIRSSQTTKRMFPYLGPDVRSLADVAFAPGVTIVVKPNCAVCDAVVEEVSAVLPVSMPLTLAQSSFEIGDVLGYIGSPTILIADESGVLALRRWKGPDQALGAAAEVATLACEVYTVC